MTETGQELKYRRSSDVPSARSAGKGLRIRTLNICAIVLAAVLALTALVTLQLVEQADVKLRQVTDDYSMCKDASGNLQTASDYLTTQARMYVMTGNREYMDKYLEEILVTDQRGQAVETLRSHFGDSQAIAELQAALDKSNALAEREYYAMKLVAEADGLRDMPPAIAEVQLNPQDEALSPEEKKELAADLMLNDEYQTYKETISSNVESCSNDLMASLDLEQERSDRQLRQLLGYLQAIVIALLATVVLVICLNIFLVLLPLASYTQRIRQDLPLILTGAYELRYLAGAYNVMFEENHRRTMMLKHAAEHDPLTGLCNRGAYDALLAEHTHNVALLLIDVDKFKEVNDTFGHDVGDAILKRVADALEHTFRSTDLPCRIGGDEFAVIMTDISPKLRHVVASKVEAVADAVRDATQDLPGVTLSVGIAFSDAHEGEDDIYRAADHALYTVKERGRNGYAFYGEK